jgi:hypothetical protein
MENGNDDCLSEAQHETSKPFKVILTLKIIQFWSTIRIPSHELVLQ